MACFGTTPLPIGPVLQGPIDANWMGTPRPAGVACWYTPSGSGGGPLDPWPVRQRTSRLRSMAIARAARPDRRRIRTARWLGPAVLAAVVFGTQLAEPVASSAAVAAGARPRGGCGRRGPDAHPCADTDPGARTEPRRRRPPRRRRRALAEPGPHPNPDPGADTHPDPDAHRHPLPRSVAPDDDHDRSGRPSASTGGAGATAWGSASTGQRAARRPARRRSRSSRRTTKGSTIDAISPRRPIRVLVLAGYPAPVAAPLQVTGRGGRGP